MTALMEQGDEDRENLIVEIIVLCRTTNSEKTGKEVLAGWSTEDLVHRFLGIDHLRWIHVIHDDLYPSL